MKRAKFGSKVRWSILPTINALVLYVIKVLAMKPTWCQIPMIMGLPTVMRVLMELLTRVCLILHSDASQASMDV